MKDSKSLIGGSPEPRTIARCMDGGGGNDASVDSRRRRSTHGNGVSLVVDDADGNLNVPLCSFVAFLKLPMFKSHIDVITYITCGDGEK